MEKFQDFLKQLVERFQELSQGRKMAVLALITLGAASLLVMSFWLQEPDFQLLYANLSSKDASAIVDKLKSKKIPYELSNQGRTIRVPADKMPETRLELASEGLPEGGEVGLEIFEDTPLGMTEFIQKLNFQRALQGELVRTINALNAVEHSRVHLVIPKGTLFLKEKPKGKASVMVKIKPGKSLTQAQIQGIVHLVSASVEGIPAENVVVVDLNGNLLSGGKEGSAKAALVATNFQHKLRVESELKNNILKTLEAALGEGKVIAQINVELDFEQEERTEEVFDSDSQVVRSEQIVTESTVGATPPSGIPGVQGLVPPGAGVGAGAPSKREKENQTLNYEINKVVKHVLKPTGEIIKVSVAVLIDGTLTGDPPEYQPRSEEEMKKYLQIVKSAVGFNADREDQVQIENVRFDRTFMQEQSDKMAQAEKMDLGFEIAKYILLALFILLFFTRVIRPIINWMTTSLEVVPETAGQLTTTESKAVEEEKQRLVDISSEATQIRDAVTEFVSNDPRFTAGIVRKWMRQKE